MDIITKRPKGMDFEVYRKLLKVNQKNIKNYLREGRICFVSWRVHKVENDSLGNKGKTLIARNPKPFRGRVANLKFV